MGGVNGDALDVARAERDAAVNEAPLHERRVPDHVTFMQGEHVRAAQRVLPVALCQVVEGDPQELARALEVARLEVGGGRDA